MPAQSADNQSDQQAFGSASDAQHNKLVEVISRSQHNYPDQIDNLHHAVFPLGMGGEIRVSNRRLSELVDVPFPQLIGCRLTDFIETLTRAQIQQWLPRLLKSGSLSGIVPVKLKKDRESRHFQCWVQAVSEDAGFTSIIGWARDVTSERPPELGFTELFAALRSGFFLSSPDGELLDVNPALVRML